MQFSSPMRRGFVGLSLLFILFVVSLISLFFAYRSYAEKDTLNYALALKDNIETLIDTKKNMTLGLAKKLALEPRIIETMRNRHYSILYDQDFFFIGQEYGDFKNLGIHVADEKGINRFFSWTHKAIGKNALKWRKDLVSFYKNPKPTAVISVGKFDMTFKGTVPIVDRNNQFLGIVESITHFNSIVKHLAEKNIYSAVVIDKRFNAQLEYPFSPNTIGGYRISNLELHPLVAGFLNEYGVEYFTQNDQHTYVLPEEEFFQGYYTVSVPIHGVHHEVIGHYIVFTKDRFGLAEQRYMLYALMALLIVLFFYLAYLLYRKKKENEYLIRNLDQAVQKKTEENIEILLIDKLTGCYRKSKFMADVQKYYGQYAVMLNLRNFSKINEMYNFKVGDEVLKLTVQRIETLLTRKIYRIHGDEFAFFTRDYKKDITTIREAFLQTPIWTTERSVSLNIMFHSGVAEIVEGHYMLKELAIAIKNAKKKLYRHYVFYRPQAHRDEFIAINSMLHDALNRESHTKIVPYFQAIMENKSGKISKYEALARLVSGDKVYTPADFLDVASSSGLIHKLTEKMIQKSLAMFSRLEDDSIGISLNITEDDLLTLKLGDYLIQQCAHHRIEPQRVTLEILEGVTSRAAKENIVQLEQLRRAGFKLAIDDFGVEYSNFERLIDAEIDSIKIDGKYIKDLIKNPKSRIVVRSITDSAHQLGIRVVAEYVENQEVQTVVKLLGIDCSQGYFFSKPAPKFMQ
jgi:EAL domain-containing protein (putative c-di-GMP-specific phosphodiesterase class I)/GGDEF domain-containing protein